MDQQPTQVTHMQLTWSSFVAFEWLNLVDGEALLNLIGGRWEGSRFLSDDSALIASLLNFYFIHMYVVHSAIAIAIIK